MVSGTTLPLRRVRGSSPDDVFVVGERCPPSRELYFVGFPSSPGDPSLVGRYDGGRWTPIATGADQYMLSGIWGADDGTLFVVGDQGTILRYRE